MLAILDYKAGNQTSVMRALRSLDIPTMITPDAADLESASCVIFPGVGAAGQAMGHLVETGLDDVLRGLIAKGRPVLGICMGSQIMLEHSEEDDTKTLGIVKGRCHRFDEALRDEEGELVNIPHMGWNSVKVIRPNPLFTDIDPKAEFYFVHSYYTEPEPELVTGTTYHGMEFCSVYGRDNLWAVQFHPEKSGPAGLKLLRNFYEANRK